MNSTNSTVAARYFNGWLDDACLFRGTMSAADIASLAKQSVATFSGLSASASVPLTVLTLQETWRQTHFGTAEITGSAADSHDSNNDGENNLVEFATGQNPHSATLATTGLGSNGANLQFNYNRSKAAMLDGIVFTVEWSDTLTGATWSNTGVNETTVSDDGTLQSIRATLPAGNAGKRFVRLRTTTP